MHLLEFRLKHAAQPLTDTWQRLPVAPRRAALLGISFRPLQAAAFGLNARRSLQEVLAYPFQLIRLAAYWDQIEPKAGAFQTAELDWQIEAAERAGKQIIVCVGAIKTFGYPEFFVPAHYLGRPLPEHKRIKPSAFPSLLEAATAFITHIVERYRQHDSILAWQLEHEAVDPLGVEHSWRLDFDFVAQEAAALRKADPGRPLMMNGFLPTSLPVRLSQWWQTRDQGDSLAVAGLLADWVGVDYYPRHALVPVGGRTLYLDGSQGAWQARGRSEILLRAAAQGKRLLVAEGQAEPWETVTTPPNPQGRGMYSCLPEQVIGNYNDWLSMPGQAQGLYAYLFWGAEYWLLRKQVGDSSYLQAFARLLENA
jgi:Beta-galactosidase